jgi:hypothetical protein
VTETLETIADRLYAVPPAGFVSARDEAVVAAKAEGDKVSAKAIGTLKRPTVAAWMINLLALQEPGGLDDLFRLAEELRSAQSNLRGAELRDLTTKRRKAVSDLVNAAVRLAVKAGASRGGLPTTEVEMTLNAALADEDIASDVRSGRLVKTAQYDGFGAMPRPDLQLVPGGKPEREPAAKPSPGKTSGTAASKSRGTDKPNLKLAPEPEAPKVSSAALARRKVAQRKLHQAEVSLAKARTAFEVAETALRDAEAAEAQARKTLEAAESDLPD